MSVAQDVRVIAIIPARREVVALADVLNSLPLARAELAAVVVVNGPADASTAEREDNHRTAQIAEELGAIVVDAHSPGQEVQGVGAARRLGFDAAIAARPRTDLVMASMDADSPADPGWLDAMLAFGAGTQGVGVTHFEHPLDDPVLGPAMRAYETWLRYWEEGLLLAGAPLAAVALGSTIACTASAYVNAAGLPRRMAGEDFAFLAKLTHTSGPPSRIAATVRPAARPSTRVPFGTGPAIRRMADGEADYGQVEPAAAFVHLGDWFRAIGSLHRDDDALHELDALLQAFLDELDVAYVMEKLRRNHRNPERFRNAVHEWFGPLRHRQFIRRYAAAHGHQPATDALAELGLGDLSALRTRARRRHGLAQ